MKVAAISLDGSRAWPDLRSEIVDPGLTVFHGPAGSAKTTVADLISHALYGKRLVDSGAWARRPDPEGDVLVASGGREYRLRRTLDHAAQPRLTVAACDGAAVDRDTVRSFFAGLSPALVAPICAVDFRGTTPVEPLLSEEFFHKFFAADQPHQHDASRRKAELVARRDALAAELEARIAGQRHDSHTLDARWRELDQSVLETQRDVSDRRHRLRAIESALSEIETRLRYMDVESGAGQRGRAAEPADLPHQVGELDDQIGRWRTILAELEQREAAVRTEGAQVRPDDEAPAVTLADQRAWLAVARHWAADLDGEVARLARATESNACACRDAHPRLRPLVELIARQLDQLDTLVDQQRRAARAAELSDEADHLARSQAELRRHLDHLLRRRQTLVRCGQSPRGRGGPIAGQDADGGSAEPLGKRRALLQRERGGILEHLAKLEPRLRDLGAERDAVDRQRAGLLSAQSIEGLRGQLAAVQRQLECAAHGPQTADAAAASATILLQASDWLAQLTGGGLVSIRLDPADASGQPATDGRGAWVVNRDGQPVPLAGLAPGQRDQVRLSLCLAFAAACRERCTELPLVLDEPFAHLAAADVAAMAAVLDAAGRGGQQVILLTGQAAAAERFAALGAAVRSMSSLERRREEPPQPAAHRAAADSSSPDQGSRRRRRVRDAA